MSTFVMLGFSFRKIAKEVVAAWMKGSWNFSFRNKFVHLCLGMQKVFPCKKNLNTFFNTKLSILESNTSNFGMLSAYWPLNLLCHSPFHLRMCQTFGWDNIPLGSNGFHQGLFLSVTSVPHYDWWTWHFLGHSFIRIILGSWKVFGAFRPCFFSHCGYYSPKYRKWRTVHFIHPFFDHQRFGIMLFFLSIFHDFHYP